MNEIKKGLMSYTPMPMRLERLHKGQTDFILDCYNANPASMQNALEILGREAGSPRIAVLGDMKELGDSSKNYHRLVARWLLDNKADYAFLAGKEMKYAADALKDDPSVTVFYGATPQAWVKELKALLDKRGGTCLLKASRGMEFEKLFKEI